MKLKTYNHDILPYCTLFKTFLQFREYENDDWIVKPCYECVECTNGGNTYYFENGEFKEKEEWPDETLVLLTELEVVTN